MRYSHSITAVDSHTAAEPTRVVTGGIPPVPGSTLPEKKKYLEDNMDWLRTALMKEPRGHNDMFGSIITEATHEEADFGIIFMDGGGYLNMCGHGTIGAATVAVETGIIPMVEPETMVTLEAPAGLVRAKVAVSDKKVTSVTFTNVPAFLYKENVKVTTPSLGEVTFDIAFGGSFFAIIRDTFFGLEILPKNADRLTELAMELRDVINRDVKVEHPELKHINTVDLIEIYGKAVSPSADYRNVVIFGEGQVDRSPCGTGTCAKMATLAQKGELKIGEKFVYESITGTTFSGELLEKTTVGDLEAYVPSITGSAWITGFTDFVIDETDPVKHGFSI